MEEWTKITDDWFVLETIQGYKIDLESTPFQVENPFPHKTNSSDLAELRIAVDKLLYTKAIEECKPVVGQYVSTCFLRPKQDGTSRFILNLKRFNQFVKKVHFKIEDLRLALNLLDENDYMARLDIKDAYLLVPMDQGCKKYLRFEFSSAPYVFTKIIKSVANFLRNQGIKLVVYLDDFLILAKSKEACKKQTEPTAALLISLGFVMNWAKSDLEPNRACRFLGMIINSRDMLVELPREKRIKIKNILESMLSNPRIQIKNLTSSIGILVAACPAVAYGWLFYKQLEIVKKNALIKHNKDTDKWVTLSAGAIDELRWWKSQILTSTNKIRSSLFDAVIFSDASTTGWGAVYGRLTAHGLWDEGEREKHINFLEIKAALLALKTLAHSCLNKHILLRVDNTTALSYISKMGGTKYSNLHEITKSLWGWCIERDN